jgi:hypothetical protein
VRRVMARFKVGTDRATTKKLANTKFIVSGRFKPHALRDGKLIAGQQQYSGVAAVWLVIQARLCGGT